MSKELIELFWPPAYQMLYDTYYRELAAEALNERWQNIDRATAFLVGLTTSGSAVAGWTLWSTDSGKLIWVTIAGLASVASIAHGVMAVPSQVKAEEDVRRVFSALRVDLEAFLRELKSGIAGDQSKANAQYDKLKLRLVECMAQARSKNIAFTRRLQEEVRDRLHVELRRGAYIQ
jgi:hypothetical protein